MIIAIFIYEGRVANKGYILRVAIKSIQLLVHKPQPPNENEGQIEVDVRSIY